MLFWLAAGALAQAPPFAIRVQQGPNVASLSEGGTFTMQADAIALASTAAITLTYRGTASVSVNHVDLSGHTDFSLLGLPELPATLNPNQSVTAFIRYAPTTGNRVYGRVSFIYVEGRTTSSVTLNLSGIAPDFAFSFIPQPGGNATLVQPGATVPFPVTAVNTTSEVVFVITNRGSGPGAVNAITGGGAGFELAGVPLLPATVEAGKELRFTVQFKPKQLAASQGSVRIDFVDRQPVFNLEGSGSGPSWVYQVIQASGPATVTPNQAIALPDALVGEKSAVTVRVRNNGNADGDISAISIQGAGLQLADVPFLPLTLQPGAAATFALHFTPSEPGRTSGRLRIGADSFEVYGNGLGPAFKYAYSIGQTTTSVRPNGSVIFTPAAVGRTTSVRFTISNTGTAPAPVNSIILSGSNLPFALSELPPLPLTLAPGESSSFTIQFAPVALGAATASLKVDMDTFTLSGSGSPPDPLPGCKFVAPSGPQEPMQQPAIGLTLDAPYPLTLTGTLTLAFNSDVFANDPAVQFATGGRTVNFTIPANTTQAVFPQNATQIRIQTGTVAGTISVTPSFATEGGIDLTPASPPALNLVVPQSAPRLLSVVVSQKTSTGFTLMLTGYATSRSITQIDFQFTPAAGENVATTRLSLNAEPSFVAWYQSTQSQPYGSLFTATAPFTLQGDVKSASSVADTIQSVSVTLSNRQGTSNSVSVALR